MCYIPSMSEVTIQVTGPGGTITYEMELIKRALESVGITVIVKDDHPWCPHSGNGYLTVDGFIEHRNKLTAHEGHTVLLKAVHVPWGG